MKKSKQKLFCPCPKCGTNLESTSKGDRQEDYVAYTCLACGTKTEWILKPGSKPTLCVIDGQALKFW